MDAEQRGDRLAVACLSAGRQIPGMEPLPLLEVPFAVHVALPFGGAFGNSWHRFAHLHAPPLDG
jgi:hypothetical protein